MAAGLGEREFIRATFGRFVSEDVARQVLSTRDGGALGGEERIVTILFVDLVGYSSLSEKMAPAEVVQMLNTYFGPMGAVIEEHQGCVLDFIGDSMFCVFGAPNVVPNHAELAVRCALAMQAKLAAVHEEWVQVEPKRWFGQGSVRLRQRIGIHSGVVVAGNVGTASRAKYSKRISDPSNGYQTSCVRIEAGEQSCGQIRRGVGPGKHSASRTTEQTGHRRIG